jgi:Na+/melibiose symporter-like transporter
MSASVRFVRVACAVTFVSCIAGLIVTSIAGNNEGWVLTIGMCGAAAAVILIVVSLVTANRRLPEFVEADAEAIEARIARLAAAGADENELRELVKASVKLGRGQ